MERWLTVEHTSSPLARRYDGEVVPRSRSCAISAISSILRPTLVGVLVATFSAPLPVLAVKAKAVAIVMDGVFDDWQGLRPGRPPDPRPPPASRQLPRRRKSSLNPAWPGPGRRMGEL